MIVFWIVFVAIAIFLIAILQMMGLLILMFSEPIPNCMPEDARIIIHKKQNCRDYITTLLKMVTLRCTKGFPTWSSLNNALQKVTFPECDAIVGITSGGYILAVLLSEMLQKPCYKMTYSRYNNKTHWQKAITYFKGRRQKIKTQKEDEKQQISVVPDLPLNQRILLVDDSIGSGATIKACRNHLVSNAKSVFTFVACVSNPNLCDLSLSSNMFLIFPWGFDV